MLKAILFDFGQTLVDSADGFRMAEKIAKEKIFADLFSDSASDFSDTFLEQYRRIRKEHHQHSRFSRKVIWQAVYRHFKCEPDLNRLEAWENEYWEEVNRRTIPFPETMPVLSQLSVEYRLAMITNTQGQKVSESHRIVRFPDIKQYFEVIILAGEGGVPAKPDPVPFHLCLERLGIAPFETVFVGDDWRIDICGAADVGIRPIWLQHRSVGRSWPEVKTPVPVITDLDQLRGQIKPL
jgi:HAD superfamily hydrolase (TIGR01549 family)